MSFIIFSRVHMNWLLYHVILRPSVVFLIYLFLFFGGTILLIPQYLLSSCSLTVSRYKLSLYGRLCGPWILFSWNCYGKYELSHISFATSVFSAQIEVIYLVLGIFIFTSCLFFKFKASYWLIILESVRAKLERLCMLKESNRMLI